MTSRRQWTLFASALAVAVFGIWWLWSGSQPASTPSQHGAGRKLPPAVSTAVSTALAKALADRLAAGRGLGGAQHDPLADPTLLAPPGAAVIRGQVRTIKPEGGSEGVGGAEVVFMDLRGETSTVSDGEGRYEIVLQPGMYQAFARGEDVLSVGPSKPQILPGQPNVDEMGAPGASMGVQFLVTGARDDVDIFVEAAATIAGRVVDGRGRPIAGAVVKATPYDGRFGLSTRPILGTDLGETDADGKFSIVVWPGVYSLTASHERFAALQAPVDFVAERGENQTQDLTLVGGCIITGRSLNAAGPTGGGAIERQWPGSSDFGPAGEIASDGTFRWVTTEEVGVTLRAWPWKSPPSPPQTFACRDGARFDNVTFTVTQMPADVEGVVRNADGSPASFVHLHLLPLSEGGVGQQERTDADGRWQVFNMPAGTYQVSVATDRGIAEKTIEVPARDVALVLSGTGKVAGTITGATGSITAFLPGCDGRSQGRPVPVEVHNGHFTIADVAACVQPLVLSSDSHTEWVRIDVAPNAVTIVDVDLTPPRERTIVGMVVDDKGKPVAGAKVQPGDGVTDSRGHFTVTTDSKILYAETDSGMGSVTVESNDDGQRVTIEVGTLPGEPHAGIGP